MKRGRYIIWWKPVAEAFFIYYNAAIHRLHIRKNYFITTKHKA